MPTRKITYDTYVKLMDAYFEADLSEYGATAKFLREQSKRFGHPWQTIQGAVSGESLKDWRVKYLKGRDVLVDRTRSPTFRKRSHAKVEPPAKQVVEGFVVNHPIVTKAWV